MAQGETVIERFDSIGAFCKRLDSMEGPRKTNGGSDFTGGESYQQARVNLLKGRLENVANANTIVDKLVGEGVELDQQQWEQSVAGYFPCVPAYLADSPECMFRQVEVQSDRAPVRVFASVCASAGVSSEDLEKRGTAILALCMKLSNIRPVELVVFADLGGGKYDGKEWACIPTVKIETSPLDLATATYCLTAPAFLRQLCFHFGDSLGWRSEWAWGRDPRNPTAQEKTKALLGVGENDLFITGGYSEDPLIQRPVEWLNEQMERFVTTQEA